MRGSSFSKSSVGYCIERAKPARIKPEGICEFDGVDGPLCGSGQIFVGLQTDGAEVAVSNEGHNRSSG
jgi:hypothetical protein